MPTPWLSFALFAIVAAHNPFLPITLPLLIPDGGLHTLLVPLDIPPRTFYRGQPTLTCNNLAIFSSEPFARHFPGGPDQAPGTEIQFNFPSLEDVTGNSICLVCLLRSDRVEQCANFDVVFSFGNGAVGSGNIPNPTPPVVTSNCCTARLFPGCNTPATEFQVCQDDELCCSHRWDVACVQAAVNFNGCDEPNVGGLCFSHDTCPIGTYCARDGACRAIEECPSIEDAFDKVCPVPCRDQCSPGTYCSSYRNTCRPFSECFTFNDDVSGSCPPCAINGPRSCGATQYCNNQNICYPLNECLIYDDPLDVACPGHCKSGTCPAGQYCSSAGGGTCFPVRECPQFQDTIDGAPCPPSCRQVSSVDDDCPSKQYCSTFDFSCRPESECPVYLDRVGNLPCVKCTKTSCSSGEYCSTDGACYPRSDCFAFRDQVGSGLQCPTCAIFDCPSGQYCGQDGECHPMFECSIFLDRVSGLDCPPNGALDFGNQGEACNDLTCKPEFYCSAISGGTCFPVANCKLLNDRIGGKPCPTN